MPRLEQTGKDDFVTYAIYQLSSGPHKYICLKWIMSKGEVKCCDDFKLLFNDFELVHRQFVEQGLVPFLPAKNEGNSNIVMEYI